MKNKIIALLCVILAAVVSCAACDESGAAGGGHKHTFSTVWKSNETEHWHPASCEHGENKGDLAPHADADEDGVCDVCAFECGHNHAFAEAWTNNETHHWHAPTCSHTDEKGSYGLHKDENIDALCDDCSAHVHMLDGAGFCTGCNKEIIPVVETDIGSVIYATTARTQHIVSGAVDYYQISRLQNESGVIEHVVDYYLGTNGTYSKRSYDEVVTIGEYPNATVQKTGKTEILEKWIAKNSDNDVSGISAISVDGIYKSAEPSAFGLDDLAGYYYAVSTLADGHGAEATLAALYDAYVEYGIEDAAIVHDEVNNKYDFSYKALVVRESVVNGETVYNVNYYEVVIAFTYADNYALTSLDITCNCWTNDPGSDMSGILEEEIDLDYDPITGTFAMRDNARADTYEISVTQVTGERQEIELNDGSQFVPTDFDLYTNKACTKKAQRLNLETSDYDTVLYFGFTSQNAFIQFVSSALSIEVLNADGVADNGVMVYLQGDVISFLPIKPGSYNVVFTLGDTVREVAVTITGEALQGDYFFNLEVFETYSWSGDWGKDGVWYDFVASETGTYTFYVQDNFGVVDKVPFDKNPYTTSPRVDFQMGSDKSFTVALEAGETYSFYYNARVKGMFTIGYTISEYDDRYSL